MIAARLLEARRRSGLTQRQVADSIGVTVSTVCGYEAGRRIPPNPVLAQMAQIYHVSVGDLDPALGPPAVDVSVLDRPLRDLLPVRAVPRVSTAMAADVRAVLSGEATPGGHFLLDTSVREDVDFAWTVPNAEATWLGLRPGDVALCARIGPDGPSPGSLGLADAGGTLSVARVTSRNGQIVATTGGAPRRVAPAVDLSSLLATVTRVLGRPSAIDSEALQGWEAQQLWPEAVAFVVQHGPHMSAMTRRRVLSAIEGFLLVGDDEAQPGGTAPR